MKKSFLIGAFLLFTITAATIFGLQGEHLQGRFSFTSSSTGTTYYADDSSTGTGLSMKDPIALDPLLRGRSLQDGDTIMLVGGTYTPSFMYEVETDVTMIGIEDQTIFDCINVSDCIRVDDGKTLTISNFQMINHSETGILATGSGLHINNAYFHSPVYSGMGIDSYVLYQETGAFGSVSNSKFEKSASIANQFGGIMMEDGAEVDVFSNEFINIDSAVFGEFSGDGDTYDNHFEECAVAIRYEGASNRKIHSNIISFGETGLILGGTGNTEVLKNHITDVMIGVSSGGEVYNRYTGATEYGEVLIHDNYFENLEYGIITENGVNPSAPSATIYQNEIKDSKVGIQSGGADNSWIYRNHVIDTGTGLAAIYSYFHGTTPEPVIENNLVENSSVTGALLQGAQATFAYNTIANGVNIGVTANSGDQSFVVNNLLYDNSNEGFSFNSSSTELGNNNVFGSGIVYSGSYTNLGGNLELSPGFTGSGYDLNAGSPLIDAADHYFVTEDFDGNTRNKADIGAYEY